MKSWRPLDKLVAGVALVLLAAIVVVLWRGDKVGVTIMHTSPARGSLAAATGPVVIEFGQRMNAASVQASFSIDPAVDGQFVWVDNRLYFVPTEPLAVGQHYTVSLREGAQGQLAHDLLQTFSFEFEVRPAGVAFLRLAEAGYSLWVATDLAAEAIQVSPADGVFDFTVTKDGEHLIYSVVNDESGIDLWIVSREGGDARLLLDCGADRCSAPAVSATGRVAYNRVLAPLTPIEPYGPPRIWLLDLLSGQDVRLHADTQKIGYGPTWSPDGRWLVYYDGIASNLVIVNILTGEEIHLPSQAGVVGSWSPDSEYMLFFDVVSYEPQPLNQIFRAHFYTQDILPFFDPQPTDADYSSPLLSPNGQWVAIKVRNLADFAQEQLWVLPPDGSYALVAVDDGGYLYNKYAWSSDSQALLYHRLQLGTADSQPSVWLWERSTNTSRLLLQDANHPLWLP